MLRKPILFFDHAKSIDLAHLPLYSLCHQTSTPVFSHLLPRSPQQASISVTYSIARFKLPFHHHHITNTTTPPLSIPMPHLPRLFSLKRNPPPSQPSNQQPTTSNPQSFSMSSTTDAEAPASMSSTTDDPKAPSATMWPPATTSARLLATVANLKITPTQPTSATNPSSSPLTTEPHSPHHWFMRPTRPQRRHRFAPLSGCNLPPTYDDMAKMLLVYVDARLKEEKGKEEEVEREGGEREFWTGERLERKGRMEGRWKGEGRRGP